MLSPREKRKTLRTLSSPQAMLCYGEHMAWVDGFSFYYDGEIYGTVTEGEKTMAVLTDRIIIMPDKKYFDIRTAEGIDTLSIVADGKQRSATVDAKLPHE